MSYETLALNPTQGAVESVVDLLLLKKSDVSFYYACLFLAFKESLKFLSFILESDICIQFRGEMRGFLSEFSKSVRFCIRAVDPCSYLIRILQSYGKVNSFK